MAAIVLLDDNFRTIVGAVAEGRQLFQNLQLSFRYLLMFHLPFIASALLVPLAGYPLLYLPVHIVWVELIIHATALLVFQELPRGGLEPGWAPRTVRFFSAREWTLITLVGGLITLLVVGVYVGGVRDGRGIEHARAMALAALTCSSAVLTALLTRLRSRVARLVAAATVASALLLIQTPVLAHALHLQPLGLTDWALVVAGSVLAPSLPLALDRLWRRRGPGAAGDDRFRAELRHLVRHGPTDEKLVMPRNSPASGEENAVSPAERYDAGARWAAGSGPIRHTAIMRKRVAALAERVAVGGGRGDGAQFS